MRIGARYGYRGMVREILDGLQKKLRSKDLTICATGGYAGWVLKGMGIDVVIDSKFALAEAEEAQNKMLSADFFGKIILKP